MPSSRLQRMAGCLMILVFLQGCRGGSTGDLDGRVLFKGEPLRGGTLTVVAPDGTPRQAGIGLDGSFQIKNIPVGECKLLVVGIDSLPDPAWPTEGGAPNPERQGGKGKPASKTTPPPGKRQPVSHVYASLERTTLKLTISPGANKHDLKVD